MRTVLKLAILLILATAAGLAHSADQARQYDRDAGHYVEVVVADPYLELHTGAGTGYPVARVVPRGEKIEILFRRTDWFKIRDQNDREGWAYRDNMRETLLATGEKLPIEDLSHRDFDLWPWEVGAQTGNFGGGNVNSLYVGYSMNPNLAAELQVSQSLGHSANGEILLLGLAHSPRPDWRVAPLLELGTGVVRIQPKATIISPPQRTEQLAYYGAGVKWYLSRRFILRGDYRSYVIFTRSDTNEDRNEWKLGFAFFF
ncbi:MAG TPA: SH3 domain-containing protein [Steroidobacteraceae bacterium]|nr:SH3 domain-containing protein [Steroidobacteraceae bacterium]